MSNKDSVAFDWGVHVGSQTAAEFVANVKDAKRQTVMEAVTEYCDAIRAGALFGGKTVNLNNVAEIDMYEHIKRELARSRVDRFLSGFRTQAEPAHA